ncbi:hypothetical protein BGW41_001899 [Actinomortierella wolfii]|nr:hypothetical protein BGW41_001899 [Actinomortierella wolfii]
MRAVYVRFMRLATVSGVALLMLFSTAKMTDAQANTSSTVQGLQNAFIALYSGDYAGANSAVMSIGATTQQIKLAVNYLDDVVGFDPTKHVPKHGVASAYSFLSTGLRFLLSGRLPQADKYLKMSLSHAKPLLTQVQLTYLFTDPLFRYFCSNMSPRCTQADIALITTNQKLKDTFTNYLASLRPLPLIIPPSPGGSITPDTVSSLKTFMVSAANGDTAGAAAAATQIPPAQKTLTQWSTAKMDVFVGYDPAYLHPYGLFGIYDHLHKALHAFVADDAGSGVREINNCYKLFRCLEPLDSLDQGVVASLVAYISHFFGDTSLLEPIHNIFIEKHKADGIMPAKTFQFASGNCKAAGSEI